MLVAMMMVRRHAVTGFFFLFYRGSSTETPQTLLFPISEHESRSCMALPLINELTGRHWPFYTRFIVYSIEEIGRWVIFV
jgi:hypothetical protein